MSRWFILGAAIALEVMAALSLRAAVDQPAWAILTVIGYGGAFVGMATLLRSGAPIGTVYGIWAASGVALTAVFASVIFGEAFTFGIAAGIAIIIAGVFLVETGSHPKTPSIEGQEAGA